MTAMKGATQALGTMNRSMNLPALQRIAMEFERENDIMDQRQEMMDDVMDDAMDVGAEEEGEEVVEQVLEEIGVDLTSAVSTYIQALVTHWLTMGCVAGRNTIWDANHGRTRRQNCPGSWRRWRRRCGSRRRRPSGPPRQSSAVVTVMEGWWSDDDILRTTAMYEGGNGAASLFCHIWNGVPG